MENIEWLKYLEDQAEISFKAGKQEAEREFELKFNPDYLDFQKGVDEGRRLGKQEGIREVVKWLEDNGEYRTGPFLARFPEDATMIVIYTEKWQAKLKDWGI